MTYLVSCICKPNSFAEFLRYIKPLPPRVTSNMVLQSSGHFKYSFSRDRLAFNFIYLKILKDIWLYFRAFSAWNHESNRPKEHIVSGYKDT
jgi:hypothetical protein